MYKLYLDDIRNPRDTFPTTDNSEWTIVRNYDEFVKTIESEGLPSFVSFDHDLADEHYPWNNPTGNQNNFKEKTGMDCAKFLVSKCIELNEELPWWNVHSANPIGATNIASYFESYTKFKNDEK